AGTTLVTVADTSVGALLRPTWARRQGRLDTGLALEIIAVVKEAAAATGLLVAGRTAARAGTVAALVTTRPAPRPFAQMSGASPAPPSRSPRAFFIFFYRCGDHEPPHSGRTLHTCRLQA